MEIEQVTPEVITSEIPVATVENSTMDVDDSVNDGGWGISSPDELAKSALDILKTNYSTITKKWTNDLKGEYKYLMYSKKVTINDWFKNLEDFIKSESSDATFNMVARKLISIDNIKDVCFKGITFDKLNLTFENNRVTDFTVAGQIVQQVDVLLRTLYNSAGFRTVCNSVPTLKSSNSSTLRENYKIIGISEGCAFEQLPFSLQIFLSKLAINASSHQESHPRADAYYKCLTRMDIAEKWKDKEEIDSLENWMESLDEHTRNWVHVGLEQDHMLIVKSWSIYFISRFPEKVSHDFRVTIMTEENRCCAENSKFNRTVIKDFYNRIFRGGQVSLIKGETKFPMFKDITVHWTATRKSTLKNIESSNSGQTSGRISGKDSRKRSSSGEIPGSNHDTKKTDKLKHDTSNPRKYLFLPRKDGITYQMPEGYSVKPQYVWCNACGVEHPNGRHWWINGKLVKPISDKVLKHFMILDKGYRQRLGKST